MRDSDLADIMRNTCGTLVERPSLTKMSAECVTFVFNFPALERIWPPCCPMIAQQ